MPILPLESLHTSFRVHPTVASGSVSALGAAHPMAWGAETPVSVFGLLVANYSVATSCGSLTELRLPVRGPVSKPLPQWYPRWEGEVIRLAILLDGWDGEGAETPNTMARTSALVVLRAAARQTLAPVRIAALADGGVALWFMSAQNQLARVECHNAGDTVLIAPARGVSTRSLDNNAPWADDLADRVRDLDAFQGSLPTAMEWFARQLAPTTAAAHVPARSVR